MAGKVTSGWIPFHLKVGAVLSGMGVSPFSGNVRRLHSAFYELATKNPDLLTGMSFTTLSTYPYSQDLQSALFRLQQSDALSADNPKWVRLQLQRDVLSPKLAEMREIDPDTIDKLSALGKEIAPKLRLTKAEQNATRTAGGAEISRTRRTTNA